MSAGVYADVGHDKLEDEHESALQRLRKWVDEKGEEIEHYMPCSCCKSAPCSPHGCCTRYLTTASAKRCVRGHVAAINTGLLVSEAAFLVIYFIFASAATQDILNAVNWWWYFWSSANAGVALFTGFITYYPFVVAHIHPDAAHSPSHVRALVFIVPLVVVCTSFIKIILAAIALRDVQGIASDAQAALNATAAARVSISYGISTSIWFNGVLLLLMLCISMSMLPHQGLHVLVPKRNVGGGVVRSRV